METALILCAFAALYAFDTEETPTETKSAQQAVLAPSPESAVASAETVQLASIPSQPPSTPVSPVVTSEPTMESATSKS